jgi:putative SOS response-associated peptidase YedK
VISKLNTMKVVQATGDMPVILTTPEEYETWLTAPMEVALKLQRPLSDHLLEIVAEGAKSDQPEVAWTASNVQG